MRERGWAAVCIAMSFYRANRHHSFVMSILTGCENICANFEINSSNAGSIPILPLILSMADCTIEPIDEKRN